MPSRRAQDERDRVLGESIRLELGRHGITRELVLEFAKSLFFGDGGLTDTVLGLIATALDPAPLASTVAAQDWPDAEGDCPNAPTAPDLLRDLLLMVSADVPLAAIETWTPEQRAEAERWAGAEHLHASDNRDVPRLPMPEHVRAGRCFTKTESCRSCSGRGYVLLKHDRQAPCSPCGGTGGTAVSA